MQLYIAGQLQQVGRDKDIEGWSSANGLPLLLGAGQAAGKATAFFGGKLDNVRFYKRALSAEEIKRDGRTERVAASTPGLVAAFDFDGYQAGSSHITDATGRHTAELIGFGTKVQHPEVASYREYMNNASLVGRGKDQPIFSFNLGLRKPLPLHQLQLDLTGTTALSDIKQLKLYATDNLDRFDPRSPGQLLAVGTIKDNPFVSLTPVGRGTQLSSGTKLWVVADIADEAKEGNELQVKLHAISLGSGRQPFAPEALAAVHSYGIVLQRSLIWAPGENHSAHYRIPGIIRLDDGTLVASIDKRKNSEYDLPEDIDIEVKHSQDGGKTWSAPTTVAKGRPEQGFGDAAMATDGKNIYMVMVSGSGLWNYPSQASKPLQMYATKSTDGGRSWEPVREISSEVYTDRFPYGGFFGSGNGIITSKGRIMFVAAMRMGANWGGQMDNVLVYSDDQGKSWHSSPIVRSNGDEAKVIELSDGSLLVSSRNRAGGANERTFVRSRDGGLTWTAPATWPELKGNSCNTALTRYAPVGSSKDSHLLLHTLPTSPTRDHLRIFLSEDEGKTWGYSRELCRGEAVYSEVVILEDGTLGIISEENDRPGFDIYFTRVSLDWIRKGTKHQR